MEEKDNIPLKHSNSIASGLLDAKTTALIRGALREKARYMPAKKCALTLAICHSMKGPRGGVMYTCAHCGIVHFPKDVQVDHIEPVVPVGRECDWNEYISRLYCDVTGLQVLCKPCHQIKSNEENKLR